MLPLLRRWYVKMIIDGSTSATVGPFRNLDDAEWGTSSLPCDERKAFKDFPFRQKDAKKFKLWK